MVMENDFIEASKEVLRKRSEEIEKHLGFVTVLLDDRVDRLARFDKYEGFKIVNYEIDRNFVKTQLATTYLLLYNLVEAVLTNIFLSIHDTIKEEEIAYDQLSENLKSIYVQSFKSMVRDSKSAIFESFLQREIRKRLNHVLTTVEHDKQKIFNGNITSKVVNKFFKDYGMELAEHDRSLSRSGDCLELIKNRRNELAHGSISFVDCGQSTSVDELERYFKEVKEYMNAIINGASKYLNEKMYKMVEAI
jgi:hypothetical protein